MFGKIIQYTAQTILLLGMIYAVLWIAEALGNLLITLFPW